MGAIVPMRIHFPLHFKNALLVGDSAGLVNPLHGGGIYPARKSAEFAAECAHKYLQKGEETALQEYDMVIWKSMWEPAFRYDTLMRSFFFDDRLFSRTVTDSGKKTTVPMLT